MKPSSDPEALDEVKYAGGNLPDRNPRLWRTLVWRKEFDCECGSRCTGPTNCDSTGRGPLLRPHKQQLPQGRQHLPCRKRPRRNPKLRLRWGKRPLPLFRLLINLAILCPRFRPGRTQIQPPDRLEVTQVALPSLPEPRQIRPRPPPRPRRRPVRPLLAGPPLRNTVLRQQPALLMRPRLELLPRTALRQVQLLVPAQ